MLAIFDSCSAVTPELDVATSAWVSAQCFSHASLAAPVIGAPAFPYDSSFEPLCGSVNALRGSNHRRRSLGWFTSAYAFGAIYSPCVSCLLFRRTVIYLFSFFTFYTVYYKGLGRKRWQGQLYSERCPCATPCMYGRNLLAA